MKEAFSHPHENPSVFSRLETILGEEAHIQKSTKYGTVCINKVPAGYITVTLFGYNGTTTLFEVDNEREYFPQSYKYENGSQVNVAPVITLSQILEEIGE